MSGNKARKLRKIATRDFKAHGGKYGIFWSDSTKRTLKKIKELWIKLLTFLGIIKKGEIEIKLTPDIKGMFRKKIFHRRDKLKAHRLAEYKQKELMYKLDLERLERQLS